MTPTLWLAGAPRLEYLEGVFPVEFLDRRIDLGASPVWVVSRARPVMEVSPLVSSGRSRSRA